MNCFSGTKTSWIHMNDIYKVSNAITSAVYAFGLFNEEPDSHAWPFFTKEIYYIGMSGGKEENHIIDKKNKNKEKGRLETLVHRRIKDHHSSKEGKIKNLWVSEQIEMGKQLYICFILPPENMKSNLVRNWLSTVESEQMLAYQQIYGQLPTLNLAERHENTHIIHDSFSQNYLREIKKCSLDRFYE